MVTWNWLNWLWDRPSFPGVRSSEVVLEGYGVIVNDTLILDHPFILNILTEYGRYICHIVSWPGRL